MSKALLVTIGAVLRRFATLAGTGLLAYAANEWTGWLRKALEGDASTAVWIPVVWLFIEFVQKLVRERRREAREVSY